MDGGRATVTMAAGACDITPTGSIPLAGRRDGHPAVRVDSPLEANFVVVSQGDRSILLCALDLLYAGAPIVETLAGMAREATGDATCAVFASHTHSAPATDPTKPILGVVDPRYLTDIRHRLSDAITARRAFGELTRVQVGTRRADHSVNRRLTRRRLAVRPLRRSTLMAPNPRGPRDETIRVALLCDQDGTPRTVLWTYCCHPTGFPDRTAISADFPGVVRSRLRSHLGDDSLPVLFLQGFSGDVRPPFVSGDAGVGGLARRVVIGPRFGDPSRAEFDAWANSLADEVILATEAAATAEAPVVAISHRRAATSADRMYSGTTPGRELVTRAVTIGPLSLLTASAEPVVHHAQFARSLAGQALWTAGCEGDVIGYLPTARMVAEGGYEGGGFTEAFSLDSIRPEIETESQRLFRELLQRPPT